MKHSNVAIIPARGGSKRLPGKNLRQFHGLPLIAWTIRAALMAKTIDRVILSTDDEEIAAVAAEHGCDVPFLRPAALATDAATTADVVIHAVNALGLAGATMVVLQPTSPLRLPVDIDTAIEIFEAKNASACVSVTNLPKPESFYAHVSENGALTSGGVFSEQVGGRSVLINGAIYIVASDLLQQTGKIHNAGTVAHMMPFERSIDIDTIEEFTLAEALWPLSWGVMEQAK